MVCVNEKFHTISSWFIASQEFVSQILLRNKLSITTVIYFMTKHCQFFKITIAKIDVKRLTS